MCKNTFRQKDTQKKLIQMAAQGWGRGMGCEYKRENIKKWKNECAQM